TPFHLIHYSAFAFRGASLTIIEATAVLPNGRISPQCAGLWSDAHVPPLKQVADFVHSQNQKLGIQLAHAGRKASTLAPWVAQSLKTKKDGRKTLATAAEHGGWEDNVVAPSPIPWAENYPLPREMSVEDITAVKNAFRDSAKRAVEAGVDVIEIHGAHGYLISSFLSPLSNRRTDNYGGTFENRIRLLVEIIQVVREVIPSEMPLLLRISATEWMEEQEPESWDVESSIKLAKLLPALGVDLLDVSSAGNHHAQSIPEHVSYQVDIADRIRSELFAAGINQLLIGAVGMITEAEQAKSIVESTKGNSSLIETENERGDITKADIVLVARQFLREPEWVLNVARKLNVVVQWPLQYSFYQNRASLRDLWLQYSGESREAR
ncbi:hypothetical protein K3495_g6810, partial [Podosphaera aphanis]